MSSIRNVIPFLDIEYSAERPVHGSAAAYQIGLWNSRPTKCSDLKMLTGSFAYQSAIGPQLVLK
ncbi:hypothetical protein IEO21_06139 [Rhodonia placenta]|uniref:Uncharacterized protein n=1 Tax=Rhodonia placenta TaxID=104341 RepID=A0A8H7U1L2_9APHY|nr:hypothetical protein IEO21_06139 [Postia placenta]